MAGPWKSPHVEPGELYELRALGTTERSLVCGWTARSLKRKGRLSLVSAGTSRRRITSSSCSWISKLRSRRRLFSSSSSFPSRFILIRMGNEW